MLLGGTLALLVYARWGSEFHQFDLKIYRDSLSFWLNGRGDLYSYAQTDPVNGDLGFTYPPFAAVLLTPFAWLSLDRAVAASLVLNAVSTAFLVHLMLRARGTWAPRTLLAGTVLGAPVAAFISPIDESLAFGQINVILAVLVAADMLFGVPQRKRWGGIGIGIAMAIKLTPGIFLLALLITRRWTAAIRAAVAATVATLLACAIAPHESWEFFTSVLWQTDRVGPQENVSNQSLGGLIARLVSPDPLPTPWWAVSVLAVLAIGFVRVRRASAADDRLVVLALVGILGLLASPVSWIHHCVWIVPALLAAGWDVTTLRFRTLGWWRSVVLLATGCFVWFQSIRRHFDLPDLGYSDAGFLRQVEASLPVWWMIAALVMLPITRCSRVRAEKVPA